MSETLEEKRIAELTERIEDFLCEGEEFLIRCQEGETEVVPGAQASPVRRNHEELYGFLQPNDKTVVYCRIGERSSHTWFVLTHLLGKPGVRNYDGSWTEWGNTVRTPIVGGPEPGRAPGQAPAVSA